MKIPITEFRLSLEKTAANPSTAKRVGGVIGLGVSKALKAMGRHPFITAGVVGGAAATIAIADKIESVYHIINEQRKRKIMLKQTNLLSGIHSEERKRNQQPVYTGPKPYQEPLQY